MLHRAEIGGDKKKTEYILHIKVNCGQKADYGRVYFSLMVKTNSTTTYTFYNVSFIVLPKGESVFCLLETSTGFLLICNQENMKYVLLYFEAML